MDPHPCETLHTNSPELPVRHVRVPERELVCGVLHVRHVRARELACVRVRRARNPLW